MKRRLILQQLVTGNRMTALNGVSLAEDLPQRFRLGFKRQLLEGQIELSVLPFIGGREGKTRALNICIYVCIARRMRLLV